MLGALGRVVCIMPALGLEPLACILDLRLDAGEVHPSQGDQHLMAVQGGFQRDRHRSLRQGRWRLRWGWWLCLAVGASAELLLHQSSGSLLHASGDAVTVD